VKRYSLRRALAGTIAASLLAIALVVPTATASTRDVSVTITPNPLVNVSIGQSTQFTVTATNNSTQPFQHVSLYIGADGGLAAADLPVAFDSNITATGCPIDTTVGGILHCAIGTLKKSFTATITLTAGGTSTAPQSVNVKALVRVNEGTDSGPVNQAFNVNAPLTFLGFSCSSVTAYRPGSSDKTVTTPCPAGALNQTSQVTLPLNRTLITITQGDAVVACPIVTGLDCIGDAVGASITDSAIGDNDVWTLTYDITGLKINLNKLIIYHYLDDGVTLNPAAGIPIATKNNCKVTATTGCASVLDNILTIKFQTPGNGKVRLLG